MSRQYWLVLLGGFATMLAAPGGEDPSPERASFCEAAEHSRWSPSGSGYRRSATFGDDPGAWLSGFSGIAATRERVFVYDGREAHVHVLDPSLRPLTVFGRKGSGPGEFAGGTSGMTDPHRHYTTNHVAVDDSLVYIYDGRSVQSFTHTGGYVDRVATVRRGVSIFSLVRLHPTRFGLMYSYDSLDIRRSGNRRLQTWRIRNHQAALVHAGALYPPPISGGRFSMTSRDPRPLWDMYGSCLAWADGVTPRVVRHDLVSAQADTVNLPPHRVPPDDYDAATARKLAERLGAPPPARRSQNAALWHWAGLIIDPDGHIWIRPWTSSGRSDGGVYRIDPAGRVHRETMPAFPLAFGPPGVFYVREQKPDTDELLITRYDMNLTNDERPR